MNANGIAQLVRLERCTSAPGVSHCVCFFGMVLRQLYIKVSIGWYLPQGNVISSQNSSNSGILIISYIPVLPKIFPVNRIQQGTFV